MKLLPYEKIAYRSALDQNELFRRLSEHVEPVQFLRVRIFGVKQDKPFEGTVYSTSFDIRRITWNRNSVRPRINGHISGDVSGSTIRLKFSLPPWYLVLLPIWCVFLGIAMYRIFTFGQQSGSVMFLMPVMVVCAYLFVLIVFHYETERSKKCLEKLLELRRTEK